MSDHPGGAFITTAELSDLMGGQPVQAKLEMVLVGGERLFRREVDGTWWEYRAS